jgi:hypothetical protein
LSCLFLSWSCLVLGLVWCCLIFSCFILCFPSLVFFFLILRVHFFSPRCWFHIDPIIRTRRPNHPQFPPKSLPPALCRLQFHLVWKNSNIIKASNCTCVGSFNSIFLFFRFVCIIILTISVCISCFPALYIINPPFELFLRGPSTFWGTRHRTTHLESNRSFYLL